MSTEVLEKIKKLPLEKQQELADFVDILLDKYVSQQVIDEDIAAIRRSNLGKGKGKIWIADDLNATPEDFKDYL